MLRLRHTGAGLLASLLLAVACQEPVDCVQEPLRCPNAAVAGVRPQPSLPAASARGQRLLQVPGAPTVVAGRQPAQEPLARDIRLAAQQALAANAPVPAGAPTREVVDGLIARVLPPAKARDFAALEPLVTPRLFETLAPLLAQDGDRLWRHLAKYATAAAGGFKLEVESVEADRAQLHLTLPDGADIRPILLRQDGTWKIDRF